jgi:two-component system phosphate regulon sensor histidine kinase PhoR
MRRLINDLLSLTRIEMNEHVKPEGRIELESVGSPGRRGAQAVGGARRHHGHGAGEPGLPPVIGEQDELVQLFQNLIHNAIKYGRDKGQVAVAIGQSNGQLFAAVRDDGEGIAASAIPRLTERFYRVDVKRSRERGGTGLAGDRQAHHQPHQGRLSIEASRGRAVYSLFSARRAPRNL